ncbi:MAG: hypothetical protein ABSE73_16150 [Planctomycetota bacterium]
MNYSTQRAQRTQREDFGFGKAGILPFTGSLPNEGMQVRFNVTDLMVCPSTPSTPPPGLDSRTKPFRIFLARLVVPKKENMGGGKDVRI